MSAKDPYQIIPSEEQEECDIFYNAQKFHSVLWDFDQWLREQIKYQNKEDYQEIRDQLYEIMAERDLNLY